MVAAGLEVGAFNQLLTPSGLAVSAEEYTMLVGPVLARLFFDRVEVTAQFIDNVVSGWLATLRRHYDHCE